MANTTVTSGLTVETWEDGIFQEFVNKNKFARYMGEDENAVIQLKEDLTKTEGDTLHFGLLTKLNGTGVTGSATLEGNEESLSNYSDEVSVDWLRNAVSVDKKEARKPKIDLLQKARPALKDWRMETERDSIIARMLCPNLDGVTAYASCTEAQKDAWSTANSDRILAGAAKSNYSADHSAMLLNVDSTTDVLSPGIISLCRRIALEASPAIRPIKVLDDEEYFVLFAGTRAFRDLKNNATMIAVHEYAAERGKDNPLFHAGDLMWEDVIIREIKEIGVLTGVGAAAIDVAPCFFCGAQAVIEAWAQHPKAIFDERDYGFVKGVGIEECSGMKKTIFNDKQHGMVTLYVSGVADT